MFESKIDRQIQALLAPYERQIAELEKHIVGLKKALKQQEERISDIELKVEALTDAEQLPRQQAGGALPVETFESNTPSSSTQTVFYLPAPNAEGAFAESSHHEQIGKSIYRLSSKDGLRGTFIMLDTPDAIATAMISISQFVKPVCKINGNASVLPRRIETEEAGTAVYENGIWQVTNKAVVRFL